MKSGLRRLAIRNQAAPPVPMSGTGMMKLSSLAMGGDDQEAYMRAYGTMGTIFSCVSLYASATAAPEWHLYRKDDQATQHSRYTTRDEGSDQRTEVFEHQALAVLQNPNSFYTRFSLFEASQQYLDLTGLSYWVVDRDPRATFPMALWPVRPDRMTPVPDPEKYLKCWIYKAPDGQESVPLRPDEVICTRYPNPLDPFGGLGPVQSVLVDVDAAKYSAEWNRNFFLNSAEPGGIIQVDHELQDRELDDLTDRWREAHRGVSRAHRVAVLEGGQVWVQNQMKITDMDFANLRGVSRDVIREAFRMHKVMLGVSDDVNRANAQTGEEVFSSWGVVPRLDRWKDTLNNFYLPMFGTTGKGVEFDYIRPIPANREQDNLELTAKTQAAMTLIDAGYDPHDVLEVVGLPDMGVAEKATQAPSLPPGWVPGGAPGAPADQGAGEEAAESQGGGDAANLLRRMAPMNLMARVR